MRISYGEQVEIIDSCLKSGLSLTEELQKKGYSFDDLVYRDAVSNEESSDFGFTTFNELVDKPQLIPAVSFFSGCGGIDLGFKKAGFRQEAAIEINETFCDTLRKNSFGGRIIGPPECLGDAHNRDVILSAVEQVIGRNKKGFDGVFHGGPPCQSFSIAANQRFSKSGDRFKRIGFEHSAYGTLLFDYVFYIKEFMPAVFLIENVPGLLTVDNGDQLSKALNEITNAGYSIFGPTIMNAADYGVPQNRVRVVIIGMRGDRCYSFPSKLSKRVPCSVIFKNSAEGLANHITRQHKADSVLRYMELSPGERDHLGRVDRLNPNLPSKTVIAGGSNGGGRSHLHPYIPRTLSVRECARLQTFPDEYIFYGSSARQFTQVGNAVPPIFAYRLAESIREAL